MNKTLQGTKALAAVKRDGFALQFVTIDQTPELCLAAVRRDGNALEYVTDENQTPEICMAAVQQNGYAWRYKK